MSKRPRPPKELRRDKHMREAATLLMEAGAVPVHHRGHYRWRLPSGRVVTMPGSPSCSRAGRNALAFVRRYLASEQDTNLVDRKDTT